MQGPPGTGKSHTIANLICHLLATDSERSSRRKTPRALQVLEGLIPDELRPLCINLLGSGLEERRSLESSVSGILRKNEEWNEDHAEQERTELEERLRKSVRRRRRSTGGSVTSGSPKRIPSPSRREPIGTAARIAEVVNRDRADYEWFTDTVPLDKICPISANDLQSVLEALCQFTPEKRQELGLPWPEPETLPSPERFAELVRNEASAIEEEQNASRGVDDRLADLLARSNPSSIESILNTFSFFRDTRRRLLAMPHSWMSDALRDILCGNSSLWHELLRVTRNVITSIENRCVRRRRESNSTLQISDRCMKTHIN